MRSECCAKALPYIGELGAAGFYGSRLVSSDTFVTHSSPYERNVACNATISVRDSWKAAHKYKHPLGLVSKDLYMRKLSSKWVVVSARRT